MSNLYKNTLYSTKNKPTVSVNGEEPKDLSDAKFSLGDAEVIVTFDKKLKALVISVPEDGPHFITKTMKKGFDSMVVKSKKG